MHCTGTHTNLYRSWYLLVHSLLVSCISAILMQQLYVCACRSTQDYEETKSKQWPPKYASYVQGRGNKRRRGAKLDDKCVVYLQSCSDLTENIVNQRAELPLPLGRLKNIKSRQTSISTFYNLYQDFITTTQRISNINLREGSLLPLIKTQYNTEYIWAAGCGGGCEVFIVRVEHIQVPLLQTFATQRNLILIITTSFPEYVVQHLTLYMYTLMNLKLLCTSTKTLRIAYYLFSLQIFDTKLMQTFCEKDQSFFHICENFIFSWNHGSKLKLVLDNHVENFIIKLYLQNYFIICKVVAREMACCAQIKYSIKLLNGLKFNTFSRFLQSRM